MICKWRALDLPTKKIYCAAVTPKLVCSTLLGERTCKTSVSDIESHKFTLKWKFISAVRYQTAESAGKTIKVITEWVVSTNYVHQLDLLTSN